MAEKGFGVKEINLIGASGTPTIESPNNLNLNAVNVAISTNATIGGNLTVSGTVGIAGTLTYEDVTNIDSVGIITTREGLFIPDTKELKIGNTASSPDLKFYHNTHSYINNKTGNLRIESDSSNNNDIQILNNNTTAIANHSFSYSAKFINGGSVELYEAGNKKFETSSSGATVTGTLTATTFSGSGASLTNLPLSNTDVQVLYTLTANGSSAYRFAGNGIVSTEDNPDVYLIRGLKYRFVNNSGGSHPFQIRQSSGGSAYSAGVTNNGAASGNIDFQVPYSAPSHLYYQCTSHGGMVGNLYIRGAGGQNTNVGVTTFSDMAFFRDDLTVSSSGLAVNIFESTDNHSRLRIKSGSSSLAQIEFGDQDDADAGEIRYDHGNDRMTFHVGSNNEKLRIESGGGLKFTGQGTSIPVGGILHHTNNNLYVRGGTSGLILGNQDNTNTVQIYDGYIKFETNDGTEKLRIASNGLVSVKTNGINLENATATSSRAYSITNAAGTTGWTFGNGVTASSHQFVIYDNTAGAARLIIDSNGKVNIASAVYGGGGASPELYVSGTSGRQVKIHNTSAGTCSLQLTNSSTGQGEDAGIQLAVLGGGGGYFKHHLSNANVLDMYSNVSGSQKFIMRIYNDGKIGQQSNTDCLMLSTSQDGSGSNYFLRGSKNSTTPGGGNDVVWIYEDGDIYNNNQTYGQQSDIKLKENIVDASSQWNDIKNLKVRNFNFKASTGYDTHTQIGLVAQEAELVSPGLIKAVKDRVKTEEKNELDSISYNESFSETETTKYVKYSVLYMKAIKCLQEAQVRIETLEAKVASLEGS